MTAFTRARLARSAIRPTPAARGSNPAAGWTSWTFDRPAVARRAAFACLIGLQDGGADATAARAAVGEQFDLTPAQVRAVEREGLDNRWPPLPAAE